MNSGISKVIIGLAVVLATLFCISGCNRVPAEQVAKVDTGNRFFDSSKDVRIAELEAKIKAQEDQVAADERLGQYAINMMFRSRDGAALSDGVKLMIARGIVRVSNDILSGNLDWQHGLILALHIESNFQRFAQSPTGPKGMGQLARKTFHEAMGDCGVKGLKDNDVWETELNLYAAACYFRKILEMPEVGGDPMIAVAYYNQGPNSADAKTYAKTGDLSNLEALRYVAKFAFLKNRNTDTVEPGKPAISDLPAPKFNPTQKIDSKN